ncbi:nicotianamine synthase family protein [Paenibacillus sp. GCM10023248]|uniref:nicotianamine synthase family protein n=1 Tax=unclassified Paenibacillus TaxID=185978 RepID=UPI0023789891|nr:nicotianamine synthase family protein [Paenibacillus sp. MAHUQ-63]MDD9268150.1 nicotianamine synthase family protein [Paenibacillus sp. MAHUQ-63]
MKEKFEFILTMKLLEVGIKQVAAFAKASPDGFELLRNKLDDLCDFIQNPEHARKWQLWGHDHEVTAQARALRDTATEALCELEKLQSRRIHNQELHISCYMDQLSESVRTELNALQIDRFSKVLFIGSGAFPLSCFTIAQETGAEVWGLDIDKEAVELANHAAAICGFGCRVRFSHQPPAELAFTKEATHIIVASLVANKLEVLEELKQAANSQALIMLRYGNGLKSLFNYPLVTELPEWEHMEVRLPSFVYDTIVLQRAIQMKAV